jgi:hypothetical protein
MDQAPAVLVVLCVSVGQGFVCVLNVTEVLFGEGVLCCETTFCYS